MCVVTGHVTDYQPISDQCPVFSDSVGSCYEYYTEPTSSPTYYFTAPMPKSGYLMLISIQEPTETSKQPIRTRYLGHVTGYWYQPIIISFATHPYTLQIYPYLSKYNPPPPPTPSPSNPPPLSKYNPPPLSKANLQEPTEISKQPIRTRYLGHVIGY
eukprot:sb/3473075/